MYSVRKKVYVEDLIKITEKFHQSIYEIRGKLGEDRLINEGLFVMANSIFEDSLREIMKIILCSFPEKLNIKSCTISKRDISKIADSGHTVIIDNELYLLFREGVQKQILNLFHIINNLDIKNMDVELKSYITKCADISLYRNALIHYGGKVTNDLTGKAKFFKVKDYITKISFDKELIEEFLEVYSKLFDRIEIEIKETYTFYNELSMIDRIRIAWEKCFQSPILKFEDYWDIDESNDLIRGVEHPRFEDGISSSEEVLLSIWRHQYDSNIPTKEFLLCSVSYNSISEVYRDLYELKFFYMKQTADNFYSQKEKNKLSKS